MSVRDLDDLIGLVPYLVGFHPHASLVVVVVAAGQVAVTARVDLAAMSEPRAVTDLVGRLFDRFPDPEAWCLAYTEDLALAWQVLEAVAEVVGEDRLGRLVQVGERRWRADHAAGLSGQVRVSPAAAQAAVLGMPLRGSRSVLTAQVAGPGEEEVSRLQAEFAAAEKQLRLLGRTDRRRRAVSLATTADAHAELVQLAVLVADGEIAPAVVEAMELAQAAEAVGRWTAVVALSPPSHAAAPLGLLGICSWLTGDGAMQAVCLERLDTLAPSVPLAAMLDWINVAVLPPSAWPQYRGALVGALIDHARLLASSESA